MDAARHSKQRPKACAATSTWSDIDLKSTRRSAEQVCRNTTRVLPSVVQRAVNNGRKSCAVHLGRVHCGRQQSFIGQRHHRRHVSCTGRGVGASKAQAQALQSNCRQAFPLATLLTSPHKLRLLDAYSFAGLSSVSLAWCLHRWRLGDGSGTAVGSNGGAAAEAAEARRKGAAKAAVGCAAGGAGGTGRSGGACVRCRCR